jgi:hypothetical protein
MAIVWIFFWTSRIPSIGTGFRASDCLSWLLKKYGIPLAEMVKRGMNSFCLRAGDCGFCWRQNKKDRDENVGAIDYLVK